MAKCPKCKTEPAKRLKLLKNDSFSVQSYECEKCHHKFRHAIINQNA